MISSSRSNIKNKKRVSRCRSQCAFEGKCRICFYPAVVPIPCHIPLSNPVFCALCIRISGHCVNTNHSWVARDLRGQGKRAVDGMTVEMVQQNRVIHTAFHLPLLAKFTPLMVSSYPTEMRSPML